MSGSVNSLVYLNEDILVLKNKSIQEYDIIEGGWSISKNNGLLPEKFVKQISGMTKKQRHIEIGKYARDNKEFVKQLNDGFIEHMRLFREHNEIDEDRILSVKKDSITMYDQKPTVLEFDNVVFTLRETASSYMLLRKKEFFLHAKTDRFWFKGLDHDVEAKDNLIEEIKILMKFYEYKDKQFIFDYLQELRHCYVSLELAHDYYRELNAIYQYKLKLRLASNDVYFEYIQDDQLEELDISYNYENFLQPLIQLLV
jgi:hypothetical protein